MEDGEGSYLERIAERELTELIAELPAISIEGAKGVGKTATALRMARTVHRLEDSGERELALGDPARLLDGERPVLIDEWQLVPESWNLVRRAVDEGARPGSFLLTGSARPDAPGTHSGAGRIVTARMRPLSLVERLGGESTVSLAALLAGDEPELEGSTRMRLTDYAGEVVASGFPGLRAYGERALRFQLDGYLDRIVDRDVVEVGHPVRSAPRLRAWMRAYAAATSTSATFEKVRDAATGGEAEKPAKRTVAHYREALERMWVLDPLDAWLPSRGHISRLTYPPAHHLVDPSLAARLLGVGVTGLLESPGGDLSPTARDGALLGRLFQSLVTQSVRVYAQRAEARVSHLRTASGAREVDLIVERGDGRVVALEVKLSRTVGDGDVGSLKWLGSVLGDDLLDAAVVNTGPHAYRRKDGVAVIPAALLGP